GSETANIILDSFDPVDPGYFRIPVDGQGIESAVLPPNPSGVRRVRVTGFRTDHAAHFLGIHFFHGAVMAMPSRPKYADQYLDGVGRAYFIDFLDGGGNVTFRVFVNSSANSVEAAGS